MLYGIFNHAQAEVLAILPESGPMARAGLSVKQGFMSAYQASGQKTPIKFVNSDQKQIAQLLKNNVNKKTQMVIGPLARNEVEGLIKSKPKVRVLALNEVTDQADNVWQFSLFKKDDAYALNQILQKDKIKQLYVFRQLGTEVDSELFLMSLVSQMDYPLTVVEEIPKKLNKQSSLLLLGNNEWLNSLAKLPDKNVYVLANAIEQHQAIPKGARFCDAPALYDPGWSEVIKAYQHNPVPMPYQRLLAFGNDTWHIAQQYLDEPNLKSIEFEGCTGLIKISNNHIQRIPQCYENTRKGIKTL